MLTDGRELGITQNQENGYRLRWLVERKMSVES